MDRLFIKGQAMNEKGFEQLVSTASHRPLTATEEAELEAFLRRNPVLRAAWEEEEKLNALLRAMPKPPVSSNFTARVLQQATAARARAPLNRGWHWVRAFWLPRHAWQVACLLLIGLVLLGVRHGKTTNQTELAAILPMLPAAGLADVEIWRDFESIRCLPEGPLPSLNELAEALQ